MKKLVLFLSIFIVGITAAVYWKPKQNSLSDMPKEISGWTIIIPGITGDLAKRKLIPALYRIYNKGGTAVIIGTGRKEATIATILKDSRKFIENFNEQKWKFFSEMFAYHKLDPNNPEDFTKLAQALAEYEKTKKLSGKRLIYLSLPADTYCNITKQFIENNIVKAGKSQYILYEKPFGWDTASARDINKCITAILADKQIYRVDHYVAKGMTQLLPQLPAKNSLLKKSWNGDSIDSVNLILHETIDIEGRGAFYDRFGAIKDIIQNHLLQILAFFSLDTNDYKTAQEKSKQKLIFLNSLKVDFVRRGQYQGYLKEKDVAPNSKTETLAKVILSSKQAKWKNVKFTLETGKALAEKKTQLQIKFKTDRKNESNQLTVNFSPNETMSLSLHAEESESIDLQKNDFNFLEAYQSVLLDVLTEKLAYSIPFEEIEAQWKIVDNIIAKSNTLITYPKNLPLGNVI